MARDFPIEAGAARPVYLVNPPTLSELGTLDELGGMHDCAAILVADGSTAQAGITLTPVKMTGFAANGIASGAIPDHSNDQITIGTDGVYLILFQNAFSGSVNDKFEFHLRINAVEQDEGTHRKLSASGDVGSCSFAALASLNAGDVITVYVESDDVGGASMTPVDAQLVVTQIA